MKIVTLLICVIALSAWSTETLNMETYETYCLNKYVEEGKVITARARAMCKCIQDKMVATIGQERTETVVRILRSVDTRGPEVGAAYAIKYDAEQDIKSFLRIGVQCGITTGYFNEVSGSN
jgi:hypothetical protein